LSLASHLDCRAALGGASLAISTVGALSKYGAQASDAAEVAKYNAQKAYDAEVSRNQSWDATGRRQNQEIDAASQALMDNQIRAMKSRATAEAAAADAGVEGVSVEAAARDLYRQQGRIDSSTVRNLDMNLDALQDEKKAAEAKRLERAQPVPVKQPSMAGLGLDIAGGALNAYSLYKRSLPQG
jgi:hypothetical protein